MKKIVFCGVILTIFTSSLFPHTNEGITGGFFSGFTHPVSGWDHVIAMVAVGLWGAFLGTPAVYLLPIIFPLVMAFGGSAGIMGIPLPGVEILIAISGLVLGLLVAMAVKLPINMATVIVGLFAIFHGHAHGVELPGASNPLAYSVGFVVSTGMLHISGILFGLLAKWPTGKIIVRFAGAVIAVTGVAFFIKAVG